MPRRMVSWLTLAVGGLTLVLVLVLVTSVPTLARQDERAWLERRLLAEAQLGAALVADALVAAGCPSLTVCPADLLDVPALAARLGELTGSRVLLLRDDGTVVAAWPAMAAGEADRLRDLPTGPGAQVLPPRRAADGVVELAALAAVGDAVSPQGLVRVARPAAEAEALADRQRLLVVAVGIVALVLGVLLSLWLAQMLGASLAALRLRLLLLADDPFGPDRKGAPAGAPLEVERLSEALDRLVLAVRAGLRQRETERDWLGATLANLADGVVIVSAGRVARLNTAAERLLGVTQHLALGRTVAEVLRDHELVALVDAVRERPPNDPPPPVFLEWPLPRRFLRGAATRLDHDTAEAQTLVVLQDLTALRRLETVRRDFVANVSHDLRTPIAAIRAMVETLRSGALDDPPAAHDFLARIDEEVEGMHRLVEQLLVLQRLEAGRAELTLAPTDAAALVLQVVHRLAPLAARAGLTLESTVPAGLPLLRADAQQLAGVLAGVVHNAIKFTPAGGHITIGAEVEPAAVCLRVTDTGVGLAPEQRERIFERFFKADQARAGGGTGLGLAIAKHTMQLHGGRIWADSPGPDRGTTVFIAIPRVEDA